MLCFICWNFIKKQSTWLLEVNNNNHSKNDIPKQLSFNGLVSSNKQEAADLLSAYFSINNIYSLDQTDQNTENLGIPFFDLPNNVSFNVDDVYRSLLALCGVWSVGLNGLSNEFLFQLRSIFTYPLWILFKRSLDEGFFSSMLKFSSINPIFKSGNPSIVSKYRPISIQSHIAK